MRRTIVLETADWTAPLGQELADITYQQDDIAAAIAMGSLVTDGMVVIHSFMDTVAGVHPRFALLSLADVAVLDPSQLVVAPWDGSSANLGRTDAGTLFWIEGNGVQHPVVRRPAPCMLTGGQSLSTFEAASRTYGSTHRPPRSVRAIAFELHRPGDVMPRWKNLVDRHAAIADGGTGGLSAARSSHVEDAPQPYRAWADVAEEDRANDFRSYAYNIAEARYVMRRVTRILNDQAKRHGLDPLLHQAMLQIYGTASGEHLAINGLADRLDVPAAYASRLVGKLEGDGYVRREHSQIDRRVTHVFLTEEGVRLLTEIDAEVHHHVAFFQRQLSEGARVAALSIFAFYVGIDPDSEIATTLRDHVRALRVTPPASA